jgi:transcriptional regulator with XRE-family HTH domain
MEAPMGQIHPAPAKPDLKLAKRLGAAIRQARVNAGLSQDELAWRSGLHRAYMGFVEQGRYNVTVVKLRQIADGLRIKPSEILAAIDL